jgi:hypothetical protein
MTDNQPPPDTGGQPLDLDGPLPPAREVITVTGPWTVLSCVTAACSRCGAIPLDEDTSTTPHFASTSQAEQELTQNWGWSHERRSCWPKDDLLLCPACTRARDGARPAAPGLRTPIRERLHDAAPSRGGTQPAAPR